MIGHRGQRCCALSTDTDIIALLWPTVPMMKLVKPNKVVLHARVDSWFLKQLANHWLHQREHLPPHPLFWSGGQRSLLLGQGPWGTLSPAANFSSLTEKVVWDFGPELHTRLHMEVKSRICDTQRTFLIPHWVHAWATPWCGLTASGHDSYAARNEIVRRAKNENSLRTTI